MEHARERWAELTNQTLARLDRDERVDHRSYANQERLLIIDRDINLLESERRDLTDAQPRSELSLGSPSAAAVADAANRDQDESRSR